MKKILLLLFFAALMGYTMYKSPQAQPVMAQQRPDVGYQAPHFSLTGMDNQTYRFSGTREKVLVLNFWASWCGPCRMEAPDLRKLYLKYQHQVDFYAINVTNNDSLEGAKAFVEQFKLPFPVPLDTTGEVADKYRINAFPTTYIIDKQGVVRQKIIGMIDPQHFERELKKVLADKP
jgi:cytochrome c biogenesis protein CcmG/thiol:disulfide interchange protein DsbE